MLSVSLYGAVIRIWNDLDYVRKHASLSSVAVPALDGAHSPTRGGEEAAEGSAHDAAALLPLDRTRREEKQHLEKHGERYFLTLCRA